MFKVGDNVVIANPTDNCFEYTINDMKGWTGVINNIVIGTFGLKIYITLHNPSEHCTNCNVKNTCYWDENELLKVIEMNRNGANS